MASPQAKHPMGKQTTKAHVAPKADWTDLKARMRGRVQAWLQQPLQDEVVVRAAPLDGQVCYPALGPLIADMVDLAPSGDPSVSTTS